MCEVWDNSCVSYSCILEIVQLEAALVVPRHPIFTNTLYLYWDTCCERLEERRTKKKHQLFYNIYNDSTPSYFLDLISSNNSKCDRLYLSMMATTSLFNFVHLLTRDYFFQLQWGNGITLIFQCIYMTPFLSLSGQYKFRYTISIVKDN